MERCSSLGRVMRGDGEGIVEFCGGVVHVDIGMDVLEGGEGSHALLTRNTSEPRSHHPSFLSQSDICRLHLGIKLSHELVIWQDIWRLQSRSKASSGLFPKDGLH